MKLLGIIVLTLLLVVIFHVTSAILNLNQLDMLVGLVCYLWATMIVEGFPRR